MRDLKPVGFRSQPALAVNDASVLHGIAISPRHLLEDVIQLIDLFKLTKVTS